MLKIKLFLLIGLSFIYRVAIAQEISGIWEGRTGPSSYYIMPLKIILELTVFNDSLISGLSHGYYTRGRFEHHKLSGRINKKTGMVYLSEDSIISYKAGFLQVVDAGRYSLKLSGSESALLLEGDWTSRTKRLFVNPTVKKWFRKENEKESVAIIFPVDTGNTKPLIGSPDKINRQENVQMVIEVDKKNKDSIRVDIYDNGEIDNDTVSVYVNNTEMISRQMISATPITFYISLSEYRHFDKIRLVAENLGSISPNTALMVITTEKKKYNVFLTSSFEKTAVVEFFLKEK